MSDQQVTTQQNESITEPSNPSPEALEAAQLPVEWRNALERIAVLCMGDFEPDNPETLVERVRQFTYQLIDGLNAKDKERAELVQRVRDSVRTGWEEARAIQEANKHSANYVEGLRSGSNTVAVHVYRALHEVQL